MPSEPIWLVAPLDLLLGFVLLYRGAVWLVDGSSHLARRLGVSVLVIGLTVVAFGTSAPEIVVSALAAWEGNADLALGNVLGSNVANIGLVLGACALVLPSVMEARIAPRELLWLFGSLALLWWVARDLAITRLDASALLGAFLLYNAQVLRSPRVEREELARQGRHPVVHLLLGLGAIALGAKLAVDGAVLGATAVGIPPGVVGLTMVAVGTSLPELAAGLGGAFRGEKDISLGNVIGSNVFNLLAVIGIVAMIRPLDPAILDAEGAQNLRNAFRWALAEDFYVVLGFSVAAVALPLVRGASAGRVKGLALLLAYLAYTAWLYATRG